LIAFLLDTTICIEVIRGRSRTVLAEFHRRDLSKVGISSITLAELQFGVSRSTHPIRNLLALAQFCAPLHILPFDDVAAAAYGDVRKALEQRGTPIGPLDMLIAAHALSLKVTLVTSNEREFRRVSALHVVNWAKPRA
jgi:tRNA(fMet)-specific endonuclease VapC